jgi:hypothetical protein
VPSATEQPQCQSEQFRTFTIETALLRISQIPTPRDRMGNVYNLLLSTTPRSRFSPRSGSSRRNIWSEVQTLQCPQRAHTEYAPPNGHPRSLPAPSPRWATHHPRQCNRANVSLQDKVRRPRAVPTNETAHLNAKCCGGLCRVSWPARRAPCQSPSASQSPGPNPSIPKPS